MGGIKYVHLYGLKGREELSHQTPAAACPWYDYVAIINLLPDAD